MRKISFNTIISHIFFKRSDQKHIPNIKCYILDNQQITKDLAAIFVEVDNPFADYQTEHKRIQKFADCGLVRPVSLSVGTRLEAGSAPVRNVACQLQYIPLQQTLTLLYSKHEFVQALSRNPERYVYQNIILLNCSTGIVLMN